MLKKQNWINQAKINITSVKAKLVIHGRNTGANWIIISLILACLIPIEAFDYINIGYDYLFGKIMSLPLKTKIKINKIIISMTELLEFAGTWYIDVYKPLMIINMHSILSPYS